MIARGSKRITLAIDNRRGVPLPPLHDVAGVNIEAISTTDLRLMSKWGSTSIYPFEGHRTSVLVKGRSRVEIKVR